MATLEYLQKHHTYAHIAAIYDIAKSNIYRGFRWVEDTLIKDGTFPLPDRNTLLKSYEEYEAILVDATETPIKRPPQKKEILLWQEKTTYHKNSNVDKSRKRRNYFFVIRKRESA